MSDRFRMIFAVERKGEKMSETCETCIWNDDGLCDMKGYIVGDDTPACKLHRPRKTEVLREIERYVKIRAENRS